MDQPTKLLGLVVRSLWASTDLKWFDLGVTQTNPILHTHTHTHVWMIFCM